MRILNYPLLAAVIFTSLPAAPRTYDMFKAYETKGSFCTVVGGACAADPAFGGGFFQNPAALIAGGENFDFDFDFDLRPSRQAEPGTSGLTDYKQNTSMLAIAWAHRKWAAGFSYVQQTDQSQSLANINGSSTVLNQARTVERRLSLPFAYRLSPEWSVGLALNVLSFSAHTHAESTPELAFVSGAPAGYALGWTLGALYKVRDGLYVGSWLRSQVAVQSDEDAQGTAAGITVHEFTSRRFELPLLNTWGASWSLPSLPVTALLQLDFLAPVENGYLYTNNDFSQASSSRLPLQKGRRIAVQPHIGARAQLRDRWGIFGGSYYEASRVQGIDGRLHLSSGISYKVPTGWSFWDVAEIMAGVDSAPDFTQLIFTFR